MLARFSRCMQQQRLLLLQQRSLQQQQQQQQLQQQALQCMQQQTRLSSSYDIFKKIQDPPTEGESTELARKPSDKVLRLVDEVMSLTLIEAADLCDLCQEKLAQRGGGPAFNSAMAAGRSPFPHPAALFAGAFSPSAINFGAVPPAAGAAAPAAAAEPAAAGNAASAAAPQGALQQQQQQQQQQNQQQRRQWLLLLR
ncbi:ribosomal protein L7/L12, putative [Eimeria acervulina]|uniref:Ribosomal protein L7/L12, putative n=1 Tax=Eimeria acervulina TaxID=5801 RepID=U6GD21_EIMAC|nr:ribosomal protein L7/L12, putative [Eimeria acervulina]CDI77233.1 ribosomal protein L7/L12, putative [Eimeria acervulina]